jgi:transposase
MMLGADMHTIAAVAARTGEMLGDKTVAVGARGFGQVLQWARSFDGERVWALEDCRHVSGSVYVLLSTAEPRRLMITLRGRRAR